MNPFLSLVRVSLLNYFGLQVMKVRYIREKKRLWEPALIIFAIVVGGGTFASGLYFLARGLSQGPAPALALTLPILMVQVLAIVFGFFALISIFYFSTDLDLLVPLPIRESHILAAKFINVTLTEYAPGLLLFVPALAAYGQYVGLSILGWFSAVVVFLLLPIIPLSIMGIGTVTLMRGLNRRHRDVLIVLASLLMVGGILYFQYTLQSSLMNEIPMEDIINNRIDLIWLLGSFFPPSIWATRAIAQAGSGVGWANLLYLLSASALSFALFMAVGQRVFYGGLVGGSEKDRKGQAITAHLLEKRAVQRTPLRALFAREWNLFIRVPIWVMNGFLAVIIIPLTLFFPATTAGRSIPELAAMVHFANNGLFLSALAVAAMIGLLGSLNTLASTSVSREGKHLWISRSLPVPAQYQVLAKLLHAAAGAVVAAIPVVVVYAMVITPGIEYVAASLLLGLVFSAAPQILGLLFDMWRPLLTWTNPQHAVKNNLNAILPMIIAGATGYLSYLLVMRFLIPAGTGEWVALLTVLALQMSLAAASLFITLRLAPKMYTDMEDK